MFMPRALSATTDAKNALGRYAISSSRSECNYDSRSALSLTEIFKAPLMDGTPLIIDPSQDSALRVEDATFEWEESLAAKEAKEAAAKKKKGKGPANAGAPKAVPIDDTPPFQLKGVSMVVPRGSLVAVVGSVGSGKVSVILVVY